MLQSASEQVGAMSPFYVSRSMIQRDLSALIKKDDGLWVLDSPAAFPLENGGALRGVTQVFETWGALNADKSNAILLHHALSVGSHAAATEENPKAGWWQEMIGPGKALDTNEYFIICVNNLGSCFGSSGPTSPNPSTGKAYRADFPEITMLDMANAQLLVLEAIGIKKLHAVVGSSMGSMVSLTWGIHHPETHEKLVLISGAHKAYAANIANRSIQHQAIRMDPNWNGGNYESNEELSGFRLARKLGLYTYRNSNDWNNRFNGKNGAGDDMEFKNYIDYNADKFVTYFDANSYITLTEAMDFYDTGRGYENLGDAFKSVTAKTLVVSVDSDILFTPEQQEELYQGLKAGGVDVSYIPHSSNYGHDAFLVETEDFTKYIREFLY